MLEEQLQPTAIAPFPGVEHIKLPRSTHPLPIGYLHYLRETHGCRLHQARHERDGMPTDHVNLLTRKHVLQHHHVLLLNQLE
jgi:hypothetical protein